MQVQCSPARSRFSGPAVGHCVLEYWGINPALIRSWAARGTAHHVQIFKMSTPVL